MNRLILATLVTLAVVSSADAQMRGMGRIQGTVTDPAGAPLPGVVVTATLPGSAGAINSTSDDKGVWHVAGMGRGDWFVDFEKSGYEQRRAKVILPVELARVPAITITMKKAS